MHAETEHHYTYNAHSKLGDLRLTVKTDVLKPLACSILQTGGNSQQHLWKCKQRSQSCIHTQIPKTKLVDWCSIATWAYCSRINRFICYSVCCEGTLLIKHVSVMLVYPWYAIRHWKGLSDTKTLMYSWSIQLNVNKAILFINSLVDETFNLSWHFK